MHYSRTYTLALKSNSSKVVSSKYTSWTCDEFQSSIKDWLYEDDQFTIYTNLYFELNKVGDEITFDCITWQDKNEDDFVPTGKTLLEYKECVSKHRHNSVSLVGNDFINFIFKHLHSASTVEINIDIKDDFSVQITQTTLSVKKKRIE